MSYAYGKIIVGEPIDEMSPLAPARAIHVGRGGAADLENAAAAAPVPATYYFRPPPPHHHHLPPHLRHHPHPPTLHAAAIPREPGEECAQFGCCFSFIPPIGFITCIMHSDAPPLSRREWWAHRSCVVASIVTIALIVYLSVWYSGQGGTKVQFH